MSAPRRPEAADPPPAGGGGPDPGDGPAEEQGWVEGEGGVRLFVRAWEPPRPRGRVVVVHGLGEHSGRYRRLAGVLCSAGLAVRAGDLRGHGRSGGRRGHVSSFGELLGDVDRFLAGVDPEPVPPEPTPSDPAPGADAGPGAGGGDPGTPTFLMGHSLGGLVVLRHLQERADAPVAGGVCVAPFLRLAAPVPGWKLRLGELADRLAPVLTLDNGLDPDDLLRDPDEREAYRSDPRVHRRISARLWGEMQREAEAARRGLARLRRPLLVQLPGRDRVVDPGAAADLADAPNAEVEVVRYPEAFHDLYHDPAAGAAMDDAAGWLAGRTGGTEDARGRRR